MEYKLKYQESKLNGFYWEQRWNGYKSGSSVEAVLLWIEPNLIWC